MRSHRAERVGRKPFHCLSMRQRHRIRQEIKLIQEAVEAECKGKKSTKETETSTSQEQSTVHRILQQEESASQNVPYAPSSHQQMDIKLSQYLQQSSLSTNSFPASQDGVDPLLTSSTLSGNFPHSFSCLPGPSNYPAASTGNGIPSTFKTEPFLGNNQQGVVRIGEQQLLNHQDRNSDILLELKKLNEKLDTYNSHFNSINNRLENIERFIKQEKRKGQAPVKPSIIPMQTVQDVIEFDNASDEVYDGLVQYLKYIGGFTLREALNLCMKEVLTNDVASNFTWHGKDTGHAQVGIALYNRQITNAFYEAVSQSQHFEQPTRAIFASQMREVLRIAKQRLRNSLRKQQVQQNFDGDRDEDPWE